MHRAELSAGSVPHLPVPEQRQPHQPGRGRCNAVTGEATIADGCAEAAAATRRHEMDRRQVVIHAVLLSSDCVA